MSCLLKLSTTYRHFQYHCWLPKMMDQMMLILKMMAFSIIRYHHKCDTYQEVIINSP